MCSPERLVHLAESPTSLTQPDPRLSDHPNTVRYYETFEDVTWPLGRFQYMGPDGVFKMLLLAFQSEVFIGSVPKDSPLASAGNLFGAGH